MASYVGNNPETTLKVRASNYRYVATAAQTVFSGTDSNGLTMSINIADVEVFLNGVLLDQTDYTYTNSAITLGSGATVGDIIEVITNVEYSTANVYTKDEVDVKVTTAVSIKADTSTVNSALALKANTSSLTTVATTGSYTDLTNKPTIPSVTPTAVSDQTNTSTGYFDLPAGTTAQRPGTPNPGMTRFNTDIGFAEYWTGNQWATYGNLSTTSVSYLIIAGGGGGGGSGPTTAKYGAGGGGAGGYLSGTQAVSPGTSYTVTVGAGGASGTAGGGQGGNGGNSSFTPVPTTAIGGGGGGWDTGPVGTPGSNGGSGGGGAPAGPQAGGSGTAGQGYAGGASGSNYGGGGGGASAVGSAGSTTANGGDGASSSISGSSVTYAGGGGGGVYSSGQTPGNGGSGGGGGGGAPGNGGTSGAINKGSGGGGASGAGGTTAGGAGGSGVVVFSYPSTYKDATTSGTVTKTTSSGNTIYTFTGSGTITF